MTKPTRPTLTFGDCLGTDMMGNQVCVLCGTPIVEPVKDSWCYGCEAYICEECSVNPSLSGPHEAHEHKEEEGF